MSKSRVPPELVGTWRQMSGVAPGSAGDELHTFGRHPVGFVQFTAEGRVTLMTVHADRAKPATAVATAAEAARLFETMIAYSGTFEVDGNKVIYDLDISWNQSWTGTKQVRHFELRGDKLQVWTPDDFESPFKGHSGVHRISFEKMSPGDRKL